MILLRTSAQWPVFGNWAPMSLRNTVSESHTAVMASSQCLLILQIEDSTWRSVGPGTVNHSLASPELNRGRTARVSRAESTVADAEASAQEMAVRVAELESRLRETQLRSPPWNKPGPGDGAARQFIW